MELTGSSLKIYQAHPQVLCHHKAQTHQTGRSSHFPPRAARKVNTSHENSKLSAKKSQFCSVIKYFYMAKYKSSNKHGGRSYPADLRGWFGADG